MTLVNFRVKVEKAEYDHGRSEMLSVNVRTSGQDSIKVMEVYIPSRVNK